MFQQLSERLQETFRRLRGKGRLGPADVDAALREVRLALLEADVHFKVVRNFIAKIKTRAVGAEVSESLTPAQQVIKIVHEELTELMGGEAQPLKLSGSGDRPAVLLLVGLQGAGKTTMAAKLALRLRKEGRNPLLVAADLRRPGAADQLERLGGEVGAATFRADGQSDPVQVAREGMRHAVGHGHDVVLADTSGRMHVDEALMDELVQLCEAVEPDETLLVLDAMSGQDALQTAEAFAGRLALTGLIVTKFDGDARGGAVLSARAVTGLPVKWVGVGEKPDAAEAFHPARMASRILGMGDVVSLIERAQENVDRESAQRLTEKLHRGERFDLEDFREQLRQVQKMGPLDELLAMLPGLGRKARKALAVDPKGLGRVEAIINSMTPVERRNPAVIDGSRRQRIANGSGTQVQDVNRLLKQFDQARKMMRAMSGAGAKGRRKGRMGGPDDLGLPGRFFR